MCYQRIRYHGLKIFKKCRQIGWPLLWFLFSAIGIYLFLPIPYKKVELWQSRDRPLTEYQLVPEPALADMMERKFDVPFRFDGYDIVLRAPRFDKKCFPSYRLDVVPGTEFGDKTIRVLGAPFATTSGRYTYEINGLDAEMVIPNVSAETPLRYDQNVTFFRMDMDKDIEACDPMDIAEMTNERGQELSHMEIFARPNKLSWMLHAVFIIFIVATALGSIRTILAKSLN